VYAMKDLSIESLRKFIGNFQDIILGTWDSVDVEVPFQITPNQFLKFAEYDLGSEYEHHLINALSNLKRAIDCQIDSLLIGLGLFKKSRDERWNFPQKIDFLDSMGIISPRILKKINQKRNLLEHEYAKPIKDDVEDAFDVVMLFIAYTEKFLHPAIKSCEVEHVKEDKIEDFFEITMDYKKNKIIVSAYIPVKNKDEEEKKKKEIDCNSEEYLDYLKIFLSLYSIRV